MLSTRVLQILKRGEKARNNILDPCTLLDNLKEEELAMQDKAIAASVTIRAWPRCDFENKVRNPPGSPLAFQILSQNIFHYEHSQKLWAQENEDVDE